MIKRLSRRLFSISVLILIFAGMGWSAPTLAASLQEVKAQGLVGEQPDGYLGLVKGNAPAGVKALVNEINTKRRNQYQVIAQRNKTSLKAVESLAGKKAIEKTAPGQYIKLPSGQWVKK